MIKQTGAPSGRLVEVLRNIAKDITGVDDAGLDEMLKPDKKTKASYIPEEYHNDFFQELIDARGIPLATEFINRNGTLSEAFPWALSAKGHEFWQRVEEETIKNYNQMRGIKTPASKSKVTDTTPLDVMVKEAEDRGFAEGVSTKFGIIRSRRTPSSDPISHELLDNGDFFYYNIKVFKNGKWIKPGGKPKQGYTPEDLETISNNATIFPKEVESAIHDFIRSLGR
jgi:hypothetical protein